MANFGRKPWVNPFGKMSFFRLWTFCFYSLERRFFVQEYHKGHFPGLYCQKKKLEKLPFLDLNHWLTPLKKCQFSDFLNFFFYGLKRRFLSFYNILEYIYLVYISSKNKVWKMAIFGRKPWVNPFGKTSIFRLFELVVFIA